MNETANMCMPCPNGTYNELYLQTQCTDCPDDNLNRKTSTVGEGSTSADNCTGMILLRDLRLFVGNNYAESSLSMHDTLSHVRTLR